MSKPPVFSGTWEDPAFEEFSAGSEHGLRQQLPGNSAEHLALGLGGPGFGQQLCLQLWHSLSWKVSYKEILEH